MRYKLTWIIALQGAFAEHQMMLKKVSGNRQLDVIQVRTPEDLRLCDALIIPGGGWPSSSMFLDCVPYAHTSLQSRLP